jgi:hypothetical protein
MTHRRPCALCAPCQRGGDCHPHHRLGQRRTVCDLLTAGYVLGQTKNRSGLKAALAAADPWHRHALRSAYDAGVRRRAYEKGDVKYVRRSIEHQ